jgi:hypothetical protein
MAFIYIACVTAAALAEFATKQQKITFFSGSITATARGQAAAIRVFSCFRRIKGNGISRPAGRQNR